MIKCKMEVCPKLPPQRHYRRIISTHEGNDLPPPRRVYDHSGHTESIIKKIIVFQKVLSPNFQFGVLPSGSYYFTP